jgi:hypothetical protein
VQWGSGVPFSRIDETTRLGPGPGADELVSRRTATNFRQVDLRLQKDFRLPRQGRSAWWRRRSTCSTTRTTATTSSSPSGAAAQPNENFGKPELWSADPGRRTAARPRLPVLAGLNGPPCGLTPPARGLLSRNIQATMHDSSHSLRGCWSLAGCAATRPPDPRHAGRPRVPGRAAGAHVRLLLGDDEPAERAGARPLADAVVLQRGGRRLRPAAYAVGVERGWITRDQAASACSRRCASSGRAAGTRACGRDRVPRLLLPLPRHADGPPLRARRAVHHRHRAAHGGRAVLPASTSAATTRRGAIRALADSLYRRVDWQWMVNNPGRISMGWHPGDGLHRIGVARLRRGDDPADPRPRLADASVDREFWTTYVSTNRWGNYYGQPHTGFAPLFGHQYSHIFIDFRGIRDAYAAQPRHRLFRELAARHARAAAVRHRQPHGVARIRRRHLGPHRSRMGPSTPSLAVNGVPRRFWSYTRAARRIRRRVTTAPSSRRPPAARSRSRRSHDPRTAHHARAVSAGLGRSTASWTRSTRRSSSPGAAHARPHRAGRRLVRHGLPRHRPGADPAHGRELPQRADLDGTCAATRTSSTGCAVPASPAAGSMRRTEPLRTRMLVAAIGLDAWTQSDADPTPRVAAAAPARRTRAT